MKTISKVVIITLLLTAMISTNVISAKIGRGNPEKEVLVFGCIDMSETKSILSFVSFMRYPPKLKGYSGFPRDIEFDVYRNGVYIADRAKPGQYWLKGFYTKKYGLSLKEEVTYHDVNHKPTEDDVFTIQAGDIYYYGTYKYVEVEKAKLLSQGKFVLEKVETPNEKELLEMMVEEFKGSKWEAKITERLATL
mgnify:CR=1 FL=1